MNEHYEGDLKVESGVDYSHIVSIGGYVYAEAEGKSILPSLKAMNDPDCPAKELSAKALFKSFLKSGYVFADGILSKLISTKKTGSTVVFKVAITGKTETSYVIEKNGVYSHGKTIKEAKASLIFKITDRDTSKYEAWNLDKSITAQQAIESYRVITGACEFGVRNFCENIDLKRKFTPREVIEMTKEAYGNTAYSDFFVKTSQETANV